jgi:hypothetical protein
MSGVCTAGVLEPATQLTHVVRAVFRSRQLFTLSKIDTLTLRHVIRRGGGGSGGIRRG